MVYSPMQQQIRHRAQPSLKTQITMHQDSGLWRLNIQPHAREAAWDMAPFCGGELHDSKPREPGGKEPHFHRGGSSPQHYDLPI